MTGLEDRLLSVPAPVAYVVITLLVFGEAAVFLGFVLPGETAVLLGGVLASTGQLFLPLLFGLVVVAAILGDSVGYEVGRRVGPRILASRPLLRHTRGIDAARRLLRDRGGAAVFLGRFTAFLRAVMPGLAGLSLMSYPRFLVFNAAGALGWGGGVVLLGYAAGQSYEQVGRLLGGTSAVISAVLVVVAVILWRRWRASSRSGSTPVDLGPTDPTATG